MVKKAVYQVHGAEPGEQIIENRKMLDGRYITPFDLERKQNVAVIGRMVQRDLIKNGSSIGKSWILTEPCLKW
jgi:putative ABC transport system permease protein